MECSYRQKQALYENGFVHIPGVIPQIMVNDALKAINHSIGEGISSEDIQKTRAQSYCRELQSTPVMRDLFNQTPVKDLVGSVIDLEQIHPAWGAQIALRFPSQTTKPRAPGPHLDGMYSPNNGVKKGEISNFTALVGIFLSSIQEDYAGNFTLWPGSHHQFESYFQEHGAESLLNGLPPVDLPEPYQVRANPGDVVIAHYNLAHGAAINLSPHVRYALFFRVKHKDINENNWQQPMEQMWMHWDGMKEFSGQ